MRLLCLSDLHGQLRRYDGRDQHADVAVIAGDVTPADRAHYGKTPTGLLKQREWFLRTFLPWTRTLPVTHVVLTWGNHDHLGEHPHLYRDLVPDDLHVLVNASCTIDGVQFYGVPQTPSFNGWAFNEEDVPDTLGRRWAAVADGTDVLVSHGPPYGVVDTTSMFKERYGSRTQQAWLTSDATNRPRWVICGHIHGSGGQSSLCGDSRIVNVSIVNEQYDVIRDATMLDIKRG